MGLLRYATTSFRITAGRVELRRGLVNRHLLSTRIERVRTVELTASPFHRVLGLTTVPDRYRNRVHQRRRRHRPRRAPGAAGPRAPRGAAAGVGAGRCRRTGSRRPRAAAGPGGAPAGPALGPVRPADQRRAGARRRCDRCRQPDPGRPRRLGPAQRRRRGRRALARPGCCVAPCCSWPSASSCPALAVAGYLMTNWDFTLTHAAAGPLLAPAPRAHAPPARRASTTNGSAGCRSASRWACGCTGGGRLSAIVTGLDRKQQSSSVAGAARTARGRRGRGRRGARHATPR